MKELTMASLFAGIGGFELSATWAGIKPIWSNEIDPWCCRILRKNFDHEIIEKDIRTLHKGSIKRVDILTGGFPCQPFSHAGKRKGKDDNRYLWPEYLRLIRELQPPWIIAENVAGLISMENGRTLEWILIDLENENYQTEIYNIPACGVGAWHKRERIWIVAHSNAGYPGQERNFKERNKRGCKPFDKPSSCNLQSGQVQNVSNTLKFNDDKSGHGSSSICGIGQTEAKIRGCEDATNTTKQRLQNGRGTPMGRPKMESKFKRSSCNGGIWEFEPAVGRVANGIPGRVDRLKGLGNAIVPQVAYEIFKAIVEYENNNK